MIFIGIILMIVLFGGMGGALYYVLKKTDPKNVDSSMREDITTAQDFIPFRRIKDSMIHLGNHSYRAIIEVSSINYYLKTEKEQGIIDASYTSFLNSLNFPTTIFISTREMDNRKFMEELNKDYETTLNTFPEMYEYANQNYNDMMTLNQQLGVNRHKKKYIIVSYSEANNLSMQSDSEKYEHSAKHITTRMRVISEGLASMGITSKFLTTAEITELMIATYHRNGLNYSEQVSNGEYLSMIVEGEKQYFGNQINSEDELDIFLSEFKNKIETEYLRSSSVSEDAKEKAEEILNRLNNKPTTSEVVDTGETAKQQTHPERPKQHEVISGEFMTVASPIEDETVVSPSLMDIDDDDDDDIDDFLQTPTEDIDWQGVLR